MKKGPDIEEHLLLNYLLGRTGEEERRAVEAWLESDPGNRKQLDRLEKLWLESGKLTPAPVAVDTDAAWEKFSSRIDLQSKESSKDKIASFGRTRSYRYAFAAAAAILLLAGLFSIFYFLFSPARQLEIASSQSIVCDTLPDGTIVHLNLGSKLDFPEKFKGGTRIIKMEGDVFFSVTKDPQHPFIIESGAARIKVLGTKFRVTSGAGKETVVSVLEGRVSLFTADTNLKDTATLVLEPGMTGILKWGAGRPELISSSVNDLFWYDRSLIFHNTELDQILPLLKVHYGITVDLADAAIGKCRLSASFRDEKPEQILKIIAETFELKLETIDREHYLLGGKGCNANDR